MRDDTVLFIITHQRAEKQLTLNYLKKAGYSGEIFLVVDNKDKDLEMYKKKYKDMLLIFDKEDYAKDVDAHINKFPMNGALFARNACIDFAKKMKKEFYCVCDDDIQCVKLKDSRSGKLETTKITKRIDEIISYLIGYMEKTVITALGIPEDGAYIGGVNQNVKDGIKFTLSKFMLYRTKEPVIYESIMWEDAAAVMRDLSIGKVEFSPMILSVTAPENGTNAGGCQELYKKSSNYANAFMVLMARPDTVKITYKKDDFIMRISKTTLPPYIINQHYKKNGEKVSM